MIFKPIFDTILVEVVLNVTWKGNHALFWLEFTEANAALVLVCETLGTPVYLKHLS